MKFVIKDLMQSSGVKFGTSGARGLAKEMTDQVCYTYTKGFLQYLEQAGEISRNGETVAIALVSRELCRTPLDLFRLTEETLGPLNLGSDEEPAEHYLIIDRGSDLTRPAIGSWLAPVEDVINFIDTRRTSSINAP